MKAISKFFTISLDELLSNDELLIIAEEDSKQKERHHRDLVFGLLDCCIAMFLFLPFFSQRVDGVLQAVSLLALAEKPIYIRIPYLIIVFVLILWGILMLALQNCSSTIWIKYKEKVSISLSVVGALAFIMSMQPYAAMFTFVFLIIKALMLIKWA